MTYPVFTATQNCYNLAVTTSTGNIVLTPSGTTPTTVFKIDNAGPNIAYLTFGTGNVVTAAHPASGANAACIPVLPLTTAYINPNLGTYQGNITVAGITAAGTAGVLITPGV